MASGCLCSSSEPRSEPRTAIDVRCAVDGLGLGDLGQPARVVTPFPQGWSSGDVRGAFPDFATNPSSVVIVGRTGATVATGDVNGVVIRVVIRDGVLIVGDPTILPRNR